MGTKRTVRLVRNALTDSEVRSSPTCCTTRLAARSNPIQMHRSAPRHVQPRRAAGKMIGHKTAATANRTAREKTAPNVASESTRTEELIAAIAALAQVKPHPQKSVPSRSIPAAK
jgi:hypothetical protein